MTSASVKDLNSLMTFTGVKNTSEAQRSKSDMGFGTAMQKARSEQTQTDIGTLKTQKTVKDQFPDKSRMQEKVDTDTAQTSETSEMSDEEIGSNLSEQKDKVLEAAETISDEICEEMNVSEEDLEEAMEVLGLTVLDLLNPQSIPGLVTELSQESDPMALVTNEELFDALKNLTTMVDATVADLAQDMDMEIAEVPPLLEELKAFDMESAADSEEFISKPDSDAFLNGEDTSKMEMSVETNSDIDSIKEAPRMTVEINRNGDIEKSQSDESGNILKTISVIPQETVNGENSEGLTGNGENHSQEKSEGRGLLEKETGYLESGIQIKNPIFDNLVNDINEATGAAGQPFVSDQTADIMDQIMDYMKIDLKPEMDQIEMQLHPASLGTVKVNLIANKAGEVTAEFKVQNEQVKAAVEAQLNDLRETFKATGNKVTEIEVSVETQSFDSNLWQGKGHDSDADSENGTSRRPRRINLNDLDALFQDEADQEEILAADMMRANGSTVDFTA